MADDEPDTASEIAYDDFDTVSKISDVDEDAPLKRAV
jgi:hypothetical protein